MSRQNAIGSLLLLNIMELTNRLVSPISKHTTYNQTKNPPTTLPEGHCRIFVDALGAVCFTTRMWPGHPRFTSCGRRIAQSALKCASILTAAPSCAGKSVAMVTARSDGLTNV